MGTDSLKYNFDNEVPPYVYPFMCLVADIITH